MKLRVKRIILPLVLILGLALSVFVVTASPSPTVYKAYSDYETSVDNTVLSVKDDFRFIGLKKGKTEHNFISNSGVSTGEYGNFTYGLIPSDVFSDTVNTGNGDLVYEFSLEGNGEFLLIRSLSLQIECEFFNNYNSSVSVFYSTDNIRFNELVNITPNGVYGEIKTYSVDFDDVLNNREIIPLDTEKLFVRISLIHETASNVNLDDVSLRFFSAEFYGLFNFVMKKGASLRQSLYLTSDLRFRSFIAKDVFDNLSEKYDNGINSIVLGNIILPVDYIFDADRDARLERDNIVFRGNYVLVGNIKTEMGDNRMSCTRSKGFLGDNDDTYIYKSNGVDYYYYDGYISKIQDGNVTRDFASKSYIRVLDGSGDEIFFSLAAFNNQKLENNGRSSVYCAQKLLENDNNNFLADRFNELFIGRIIEQKLSTQYRIRKIYVDSDYTIIHIDENVYDALINEDIVLNNQDTDSEYEGFIFSGGDGIRCGDNVLYINSALNKAYPLNKSVIDLYFYNSGV